MGAFVILAIIGFLWAIDRSNKGDSNNALILYVGSTLCFAYYLANILVAHP